MTAAGIFSRESLRLYLIFQRMTQEVHHDLLLLVVVDGRGEGKRNNQDLKFIYDFMIMNCDICYILWHVNSDMNSCIHWQLEASR